MRTRRNGDVDALVRDRLTWLDREIADRETSISGMETTLAGLKEKQVEALGERARLLAFLPDERAERCELIERILEKEGLVFREEMSREDREALDVERQALVLRLGLNAWPLENLRASVEPPGEVPR